MSRKTKEERLAEQKELLERASQSADTVGRERSSSSRHSVFGKNMVKDTQMKLDQALKLIDELNAQIAQFKHNGASSEVVDALKEQIKALQERAIIEIPPSEIEVTSFANRDEIFFRTEEFYELIESIRSEGQAIPITVRRSNNPEFPFQLVSGRRRLEACRKLDINVDSIVVEADDKRLLTLQVLENFRHNLNHFEECDNYLTMLSDGYFDSAAEISRTFGQSAGKISQILSLQFIPLWLREGYLINSNLVADSDYIRLDLAPYSLLRGDFVKLLKSATDERINSLRKHLEETPEAYNSLGSWAKKIQYLSDFLAGKQVAKIREDKSYDIDSKIRVSEKYFGSIKAGKDDGITLKINKKYYSRDLAKRINDAINQIIEDFEIEKNGASD